MKKKILEYQHVEKPVLDWCKRHGVLQRKMNGLGFRGWPDRMFLIDKVLTLFIEFKVPGGHCTELQLHIHKQLQELGYPVHVFDNAKDAITCLTDWLDAARGIDSAATLGSRAVPKARRNVAPKPRGRGAFPRPRTR